MKKIIVACGAGVVTSTTAMNKLNEELSARGYQEGTDYKLMQTSVQQVPSMADQADLAITTTQYDNDEVKIPVINGLPLLTGIGADDIIDKVEELIKA
ncbi:PTS sugar transporter subunit IIB [uncultured Lactobacillus sp.]|uniref:PTS sugar transporter subunit IIB n=1 Tax=uncultured Lactobacillus sp. TaxID=153152 RepID=UPI00261D116A|nr:PTS sugar transporter subunit IIB [uncultured Lactobacillus sp.]